jgi:putative iron-dependent peroxidase
MTGFVDGTANPPTRTAPQVAMVPAGAPGEGGSHVLAMRWVHALDAFQRLPVAGQEAVIGRTKQESIELTDAVKPATAHIARVEVHDAGGSELAIFRRSVPYGSVAEHGLCFVAFSGDRLRFDVMLERMFGLADDGLRDRLTDFSRPVSGGYYFAPSLNALAEVGGAYG